MTKASDNGPNDRYNLSLILFYTMGIVTQVSSSFILNAQLYWKYKFRDVDKEWDPANDSPNELQKEFTADFSVVGNVTPLATIALSVIFTRRWNITYRILACFTIYIAIYLLIMLFALIDTDSWQRTFFYTTIVIVVLATSTNSLFLVTLLHLCAKFPPIYLAAMLSGQAMCGIFSSSVQILTLIVDSNPTTNGLLYFSVAMLCIIVTFIMFLINRSHSKFFQYQIKQIVIDQTDRVNMKKELVFTVLRNQKTIFFALLFVAGATTMIQPGITSTIRSMDQGNGNKWNDTYFVPAITFLAYFICDLCGRELAMRIAKVIL
ncbi:hypothetical protein WA026_011499 [Henosepilachna vigintioctopunctata]|uniref:Uncharacterized protein n=1 Tax=Henosepilachna vigintioctopunctata TaxID=420089 RepID=A0AAW1TS93_9CUCU